MNYYYKISAVSAAGESANTYEVSAMPALAYYTVNFDVPGGDGGINYAGQGAYPDAGHNYWNPFVLGGTTGPGKDSDGATAKPIHIDG